MWGCLLHAFHGEPGPQPRHVPLLGIRNQTSDLLVCWPTLNPLSHSSQGLLFSLHSYVFFDIMRDEMGSTLGSNCAAYWKKMSSRKKYCAILESQAALTALFREQHFHLEEWMTNYGYSDLSMCQTFSWKWTKSACHYKENNLQYFLPKIKSELSGEN